MLAIKINPMPNNIINADSVILKSSLRFTIRNSLEQWIALPN